MDFKELYRKIITPEKSETDKKLYVLPLIPALLWIILSVISIFTVDISIISDPFVIVSLLARIIVPLFSLFVIKKFYLIGGMKPINYNHMLNMVGYSIAVTYVSYMLPGVVLDFHNSGASTLIFTIFVILSTLCPVSLYLLLKSSTIKLASGYFTKEEVDREKKIKKDKKLKKENQKKLRKERSFLQNLWFELVDPLMWAILWVLIINNTLFQLYEIPSSSMVPEFLEKDRVVASKLFSGPGIPLTKYKLPEIGKPKTGDIVTFNNPKVDDPNSDLHYKNIFTRIFQPFFFMLSFAKIDIDSDANGYPKARQLVKRVIAVPGEKISMVNDKVYKKVDGGEWTLMSDIPGEKEWGRNDLFSSDSPNSGDQYMNPKLREELDEAAKLVFNSNIDELNHDLNVEKIKLISFLENMDKDDKVIFLNSLMSYNRINDSRVTGIIENMERSYFQMMQLNRARISADKKRSAIEYFDTSLDRYDLFTLFDKINDFRAILQEDVSRIDREFNTTVKISENSSPYDIFVSKLDGLTKLRSLQVYNQIISTGEFVVDDVLSRDIKLLYLYTTGLQFISMVEPLSFFGAGNLPEYPKGAENYIPKGEYFLLGDNRYNSLDSRMGDVKHRVFLGQDNNEFSTTAIVRWEPHTISDYYIHGKVAVILFPFDRFKLF